MECDDENVEGARDADSGGPELIFVRCRLDGRGRSACW